VTLDEHLALPRERVRVCERMERERGRRERERRERERVGG